MSGTLPTMSQQEEPTENSPFNSKYKPSPLQMKLVKQRDKMRTKMAVTNEPKKNSLISASRLQIPKNHGYQRLGNSPLVDLESDSEDELFLSSKTSPQNINKQLSQQLARDGFQLDETPDDETLDLIPPNEFRQTDYCACCSVM